MHRQWAIDQLSNYQPHDEIDRESLLRTLRFVHQNEGCFERDLKKGHVTGSAWLMSNDGSKALLTLHRKLKKWIQLGGHADGDSNILRVAIKEAQEESGIEKIEAVSDSLFDIDVHFIPPTPKESAHFHYDFRYLLKCSESEEFQISDESIDLKWFGLEELKQMDFEPSVQRLIYKWERYLDPELLSFPTSNWTHL